VNRSVVVITGAANGIGAATARAFARAGSRLVLADLDEAGVAAVTSELAEAGAKDVLAVTCDVTSEAETAALVEQSVNAYDRIDVLVNVVGGSRPGKTVVDLSLDDWNRWVALNLTSVFLTCRQALPYLIETRGAIVNVASGAGIRGMRANPAYVAAKAGVVGLTKALAIDHGPQGVRVNGVAPGPIRTPLMARNRTPDEIAAMGAISITGRIGEPAEIAAAIVWLVSDAASYVMGQTLEVDGGVSPWV
jgi:NAD(P)-dependent dehydrogenase (short-subunit alcohol dehydrogenase family)